MGAGCGFDTKHENHVTSDSRGDHDAPRIGMLRLNGVNAILTAL
jgi:hypothetical protein